MEIQQFLTQWAALLEDPDGPATLSFTSWGESRHCLFFFNCLATSGYVSCKKMVSSRELEAVSVWRGLQQKGWKGKSSSGRISLCHLTSGLKWRGLAFVQSTLHAKQDGIWKHTKRERLSSFVPHGHYLYRQRVISISRYSGLSSSSFYWTFSPLSLDIWVREQKTQRAGTSCKEISISFVVVVTGL